jgi:glycosyltransferase involved in cell wall biosynthesis
MSRTIHIVCLDCPSPPDYGGAIDMFYKIKALSENGEKIILHYFDYNPLRNPNEIAPYCTAIYAYKRKNLFQSLPLSCPFIVQSRINEELIHRLNDDEHPILLEGLHCSGIVPFLQKKERVILRMHNDEASYYHHLFKTETSFFKRKYFWQESRLLRSYQRYFDKGLKLACLSETDLQKLKDDYKFKQTFFLPCFLPWQKVASWEGKGDYCLYHGNLSISENGEAAQWLIEDVFSQLQVPFVVAGKNISKKLFALAKKHSHVVLINNPPADELAALIRDAHIHVLPSMNSTGVKLKLLNALLNGRHCITNHNGIAGSQLEKYVRVDNIASEWITAIDELLQEEFTSAEIEARKEILSLYNNRENARRLSAEWLHYQ